ncbi:P-loop containing nucleoside triphosphate hydrolase protein [Papiliotrema laurentii]|uniref:P-loop containing nucleoside triphosphate hydrolase protein n=1 Tax=Papiliotrema laurentii TaxID=5418 RepID=A0AAD9FTH8_PAPLA|nr:P-loop containing nucleoside triphosphate hydrolase protein [Papiliotrema laurentii]
MVDIEGVGRTGKARASNDNMIYEGQVVLPFNPLYVLAGLTVSEPKDKRKLIPSGPGLKGRDSRSSSPPHVQSLSDRGVKLEKGDENEWVSTKAIGREQAIEAEHSEEEFYEDSEDDEVLLPSTSVELQQAVYQDSASAQQDVEGLDFVDDAGVYSEDEMFAAADLREDLVEARETPFSLNEDVPIVKPNFLGNKYEEQTGEPLRLGAGESDVSIPAPLNRYLKSYQREGVRFFYQKYAEGRGAILGDDMGLGKTIQVIAFLSAIMRKTGTSTDYQRRKKTIRSSGMDIKPKHWPTALIVCPKFLIRNWERELQTWGYFEVEVWQTESWIATKNTFLRGYLDIILVSYETARISVEQLKDLPFSVVIADEAHRLKEPKAAITLAMKKLQCPSCFALSGTIVQNRLDEMWSILDFVDRGWAGTLKQWRDFVVNPIKKGHRYEGTVQEVVTAVMRLGVMHEKVLPHFYLRRDKRLIANELPDKRDLVVFCPLASKQIAAYRRFIASDDVQFILRRNEPCQFGSGWTRSKCHHGKTPEGDTLRDVLLKSINALSKISNHLGLLYHGRDDTQHTREVNDRIFKQCMGETYDGKRQNVAEAALDPGNCGKWKLLADFLKQWRDEAGDNKVLIFSNSVRLLKMVAEFISSDCTSNRFQAHSTVSYPFEILTGEVSIDDRMAMVDRFQDPNQDQYILLISTMAGGVGLNLTAANKVVIFDPAWNPANDLQAMDRAFRIGQKRTVDVYRLIGQGTLEELMYERQIQKQQRSRQLNEGTFESRIHQGIDRGRTVEEQGELFGTQNIFKFDPQGFVPGRLERVRQAEDKFVQDLIDAEYGEDEDMEDEVFDDFGKRMREDRRLRDRAKAQEAALRRRNDNLVMQTVLGYDEDGKTRKEDDMLRSFGINSQIHDTAFRDSPEERAIFEIGLKLLKSNPEIAAKLKANDLGKLGRSKTRPKQQTAASKLRKPTDPVEEPWRERIAQNRRKDRVAMLAELSD